MNRPGILILMMLQSWFVFGQSVDRNEPIDNWYAQTGFETNTLDLSMVFYYDSCSYLGVIGEDMQKINIRFDTLKQINSKLYAVDGKILLSKKIYMFTGNLHINDLHFLGIDKGQMEIIFLVKGDYTFNVSEDLIMRGKFKRFFAYSIANETYTHSESLMEVGTEEGFSGELKDTIQNTQKYCYFGFQRYPAELTKDFDNQGGEPLINKKYKNSGWESYFENSNIGYYLNIECNFNWWE